MHFLPWLGNLHHTMTHRVFMAQDWKGCASLTGAFQGFGLLRIRENKPPHLATLQRCSSPNHRPFQTSVKITIRYVFQPLRNRWASQGFITHSWPKKCFKSRKANFSQHFTITLLKNQCLVWQMGMGWCLETLGMETCSKGTNWIEWCKDVASFLYDISQNWVVLVESGLVKKRYCMTWSDL